MSDCLQEEKDDSAKAQPVDAEDGSSSDEELAGASSDEERHSRMIADLTGKQPAGKQKQRQRLMTEAYPESEANLPPAQGVSGAILLAAQRMTGTSLMLRTAV